MEILIFAAVCTVTVLLGVVLVSICDGYRGEFATVFFGTVGCVLTLFGAIGCILTIVVTFEYFGAGYKAQLLNTEYGTSYTRAEVFFAEDLIDTVRELKRERIEINGNLLKGDK